MRCSIQKKSRSNLPSFSTIKSNDSNLCPQNNPPGSCDFFFFFFSVFCLCVYVLLTHWWWCQSCSLLVYDNFLILGKFPSRSSVPCLAINLYIRNSIRRNNMEIPHLGENRTKTTSQTYESPVLEIATQSKLQNPTTVEKQIPTHDSYTNPLIRNYKHNTPEWKSQSLYNKY